MITLYCHRWSVFATLLFLCAELGMPYSGDAAQLPPQGRDPNPKSPQAVCIDEHITIKARSVPREQVLDGIAKACHLKIYSPSAEKSRSIINVDFTNTLLGDALGELLRGSNYLVVYNESLDNRGFVSSMAQAHSVPPSLPTVEETASTENINEPVLDEQQERADFLRNQIEMLNERITSGASDRFYEQAIKSKPAEFVENDRETLAQYQDQLTALMQ